MDFDGVTFKSQPVAGAASQSFRNVALSLLLRRKTGAVVIIISPAVSLFAYRRGSASAICSDFLTMELGAIKDSRGSR